MGPKLYLPLIEFKSGLCVTDDYEVALSKLVQGPLLTALRGLPEGEPRRAIVELIEQLLEIVSDERKRLLGSLSADVNVENAPKESREGRDKEAHLRNRILFVDDNKVNQQVARLLFSDLGLEVHAVDSGGEALSAFYIAHYDLVFLDCQLSDFDSYEVCKAIKALQKVKGIDVPVIGMTGSSIVSAHAKCLDAGLDDCIKNPLEPAELTESARHWLRIDTHLKYHRKQGEAATGGEFRASAILDEETLHRRFRSSGVREVLTLFSSTSHDEISKIKNFLFSRDFVQARRQVHSLKGASSTICALRLTDICNEFEGATGLEDLSRCASLYDPLVSTLEATLHEIETCLSALPCADETASR